MSPDTQEAVRGVAGGVFHQSSILSSALAAYDFCLPGSKEMCVRNPTEIKVQSAIVHLLRRDSAYYSQAQLELADHDRVTGFLGSHIHNSLTHDRAQTANFVRDASDAAVYHNALSLLANGGPLVQTSTGIANHLHKAIVEEGRASEGAIAICVYSVENEAQDARFLAVLKLEPGGAFRPVKGKKGGKQIVNLTEIKDVLPSEREQLQKAALISTPNTKKPGKGSYDLMVLDRQKRDGGEPAGYFMKFLRAELAMDAFSATYALHNVVHKEVTRLGDKLSLEERETVYSAVRTALGSKRVEPIQLIDNLVINDDAREAIKIKVQDVITDASFMPDKTAVTEITKRRRFTADNGIRLLIDDNAAQDKSIFNTKSENGITVVTLRARNWREVAK
jgi:hypothetical protein